MGRLRVHTPVADYTGQVGTIHFQDGVAEVADDAMELHHMHNSGYLITDLNGEPVDPTVKLRRIAAGESEPAVEEKPVVVDVDGDGVVEELPKKTASVGDWRAFAVAHGMTEADAEAMTKDALINHYNTPKEG